MRLLITLIRRYPAQSIFSLVALIFAGIAEGFGMSMLLPLLGIAIDTPGGSAVSSHASRSALEQAITGFFGTIGMTPTVG
jgi:ATP-binding cassette subfamily C protein